MSTPFRLRAVFACAILTLLAIPASAQVARGDAKRVDIVIPFPPGGATDVVGRSLAREMQSITGQSFVVENKPGATGAIAAEFVKRAAPDGGTLLLGTGSVLSVLPAVKSNLPFDAERDFAPIVMLATSPYILLVNAKVPASNLNELIALLKATPGKYNYSTSGIGSVPHLAGELFKQMAGVDMTHVPYQGNAPATTAAVSGDVQITIDSLVSSIAHVQAGRLKALGIASSTPMARLPGVPTVDTVLPGFNGETWLALFAPSRTPAATIQALRTAALEALKRPGYVQTAEAGGFGVPNQSLEETAKFLRDEIKRWTGVAKTARITLD